MISDFLFRIRALFRRKHVDRELEEELRSHFEHEVEKRVQQDQPREMAIREAKLAFGGMEQVKDECRQAWGVQWLQTSWQDIRYGLRSLRKSPGFTLVAVLTLALGIGATTAIFSVANPVMFRPLPFREPGRIMTVLENKPAQNLDWLYATQISFVEWQRRAKVFESIAAYNGCGFRLPDAGEPRFLRGSCVSSSFFPMLGVKPMLGRLWTAEEDVPGDDHVAVLSYSTWKQDFGGDPAVLNKKAVLNANKKSHVIIGVLPPDFQFVSENISVWAPSGINTNAPERFHELYVFARLRPGVTQERAQASMDGIARQLEQEFPKSNKGWGATVRPLQEFYSSLRNTRSTLWVLLAAVCALLLIACANVANLLLARATARQQEIAIRMALGASRARLLRQLLTESLLLSLLGGAAGFLLAWAGFTSIISIAPSIPTFEPGALRIDTQVLFFSMAASLLVGTLFGLAPALRMSRKSATQLAQQSGRSAQGSLRDRAARNVLVVSEVGLAVALMIGSALLVESLRNLQNDSLGFAHDHVLTMSVCCAEATQPEITRFFQQLLDRTNAVPGVEAASLSNRLPMRSFDGSGSPILIQGRPVPPPGKDELSDSNPITPGYLATLKIPLLRGRDITTQDDADHPPAVLVNEAFVQRYLPKQDPIGQQVQLVNLQPFGRWLNIVGVIANSRERGLGKEVRPTIYLSHLQVPFRGSTLLVRTKAEPQTVAASLHGAMKSVKPDLSIGAAHTMDDLLSDSLSPQRFSVTLLSLFTAIALGLALVGVYGVMAYMVSQRTREIGIRMALGAQPRDMLRMVITQGLRLALAGVAAGIVGALVSARLISSLLFGVSARDPMTALIVSAALTGTALLACYVPARRAMKVDPMVALRYE